MFTCVSFFPDSSFLFLVCGPVLSTLSHGASGIYPESVGKLGMLRGYVFWSTAFCSSQTCRLLLLVKELLSERFSRSYTALHTNISCTKGYSPGNSDIYSQYSFLCIGVHLVHALWISICRTLAGLLSTLCCTSGSMLKPFLL